MIEITDAQTVSDFKHKEGISEEWVKIYSKLKKQFTMKPENTIRIDNQKKLVVIFDHAFGGGANLYSSTISNSIIEKDFIVLLIAYNFHTNTFNLSFQGSIYHKKIILETSYIDLFESVIKSLNIEFLIINELVSWPNPLDLTKKIIELNIPYIINIHDFFYICPSWHLLNEKGIFCTLDVTVKKCTMCLTNNNHSDHTIYYGNSDNNIHSWREHMNMFLQNAKQIIFFSESTKNNLLKIYGNLSNITVAEHSVERTASFKWKKRGFNGKTPLTIGVIGKIEFQKGAGILKELAMHPNLKGLPVRIVVIGEISSYPARNKNDKFIVHGPYLHEELAEIAEKYDVSTILIPSICPETFSFTTSEALLLGYPVICFDIGAPAERIKKYNSGIVIDNISTEGLISVFRKILDNPQLIKELSANTINYIPPSLHDHLEKVFSTFNSSLSASRC